MKACPFIITFMIIKGIVHPKIKKSVIICHQTCMTLSVLSTLKQDSLGEVPVVFCPYIGSQWQPKLFGYQCSSKYFVNDDRFFFI